MHTYSAVRAKFLEIENTQTSLSYQNTLVLDAINILNATKNKGKGDNVVIGLDCDTSLSVVDMSVVRSLKF